MSAMSFCLAPGAAALRPTTAALCSGGLRIASFAPPHRRRRPPRRIVSATGSAPENVAVVGGGLAGLATAYHLLNSTYRVAKKRGADFTQISVTIFDPAAPGTSLGASRAAAGLLHRFTPRAKKQAWRAEKSLIAALSLIDIAQMFSDEPLLKTPGILRYALTEKSVSDFRSARGRFPREMTLLSASAVEELVPDPPPGVGGVLHTNGCVVNTPAYLRALWAACAATNRVSWVQEAVASFESLLGDYDAVIICAGAATRAVSNLAALPILPCRGQNVRYRPRFPEKTRPPPVPLIAGKYIIPDLFASAPGRLLAGATFEYCSADASAEETLAYSRGLTEANMEEAHNALAEPLAQLSPMLGDLYEPDGVSAGVRALPPRSVLGSVPLVAEVKGVPGNSTVWVFTGLGSRGLLHHAYLGKLVARAAVGGSDIIIPLDARRVAMNYEDLCGPHKPETASKVNDRPSDGLQRQTSAANANEALDHIEAASAAAQ